ncbi:MAG TPA: hypothetical protein VLF71_03610, partial [Candidatus Saccharimonadales bacterium]|nr:hypothetical protein [Candidatus Saccharimonadales bacterium]
TAPPGADERHQHVYNAAAVTLMGAILSEARPGELVGVLSYEGDTRSLGLLTERFNFGLPPGEVWGKGEDAILWARAVPVPVEEPVPQPAAPRMWTPTAQPRTV